MCLTVEILILFVLLLNKSPDHLAYIDATTTLILQGIGEHLIHFKYCRCRI